MSTSVASVHDAPIPPFAEVVPQMQEPGRGRIDSIDLLRGIVMVIMMLDHTRDFVHYLAIRGFDPTDLSNTSVKLFLTRWITHFCAPVFVFLAGTGIYLQLARGKSKSRLSRFLVTRGLWLIFLEFTWVRIAVTFNFDYRFLGLAQVIWVIGVSMIVLALLIHLPVKIVGAFGVIMIAAHNLLDRFHVQGWRGPRSSVPGFWTKIYIILHQSFEGFPVLWFFPSPVVFILYPLIPWIGVMAAGFAFGSLYQRDGRDRRRWLLMLGTICTLLFVILRLINVYGDPAPWVRTGLWKFTAISFLNVTKYPPSLLFLLMTLGPSFLALAWFEASDKRSGVRRGISNFFINFGRVPLFFYLLQWPTAHFLSVLVHLIAGKPVRWMFGSQIGNFTGPPPGVGFNLAVVYLCWIAGVLLLYPLCKWFAGVKARHRTWWLSYL
ncbi:MAG TPA: heparan-alpha-glucosaminide N-acetyltransferase domain-containing protein [Pyrinomonadaceae bacterium]|nr:heparan-alpha-glucosaminide N-acetyltransferase domain-containing protein [Pyrinomonadaceae bacterium]